MRLAIASALLMVAGSVLRADDKVDFGRDILPILSDNCFHCHGPDPNNRKAKLRLDTHDGALATLRSGGKAVVPGKIEASELVQRIEANDVDDLMPPAKSNRKLSARQIELLKKWIAQGAPWGQHWAFVKPQRPDVPTSKKKWGKNPIDAFILARLEREKLTPSPEADKVTLLRRVTLDLTGLPPTPTEVDAFLNDKSPKAYEKVVDRLLRSPRYGERMVWDWLDAARYADTNGYQGDNTRTMWPWRDWAIDAFNRNMPFDQFTIEQLAGDMLPAATREQKLATGFCRNHMINGEGGRIAEENRVDYIMDQIETVGTVWLGLTVGCARCHDHKYDPLTMREYYQLFAFFNQTPVDGVGRGGQTAPVLSVSTKDDEQNLAKAGDELKAAVKSVEDIEKNRFERDAKEVISKSKAAKNLSDAVKQKLDVAAANRTATDLDLLAKEFKKSAADYADALAKQRAARAKRDDLDKQLVRVMVMEESKPRDTFLLNRGLYNQPGVKVQADVPAAFPKLSADQPKNRLALARWLISPEHPLTARVTVNRFWQMYFGTGLVKTPEDFGVQGETPSHPELLDWLATEFVRSGWDMRALHRLIVTSATYRQSSKVTPALLERDPVNRLLARGPRFRMPAYMIRDQALAASGLLVEKVGGPPVKTYQPAGVWEDATFGNIRYQMDKGDALYRRSLYTFWRRIVGPTMFFDTTARQVCNVKTMRTNTPLHALSVLNDITYIEASRVLAQRVLLVKSRNDDERIEDAFRLILARKPQSEEASILRRSLERLRGEFRAEPDNAKKLLAVGESKRDASLDAIEHAAFAGLCSALFNLDEALSKE